MVREKLLESSIQPILLFSLFLVLLYLTRSSYSITARVQFSILAMFVFLMCSFDEYRNWMGFYRYIAEYKVTVYAICGLGFSLFAFRQFGFKRFNEIPRATALLWALVTGILLNMTLSGVFYLIK